MREIAPGLLHWTAPHPDAVAQPEPGSAADWPPEVGCTLYEAPEAVVLIEWGDAIAPALPADYLEVRITLGEGDDDRDVGLTWVGPSWTTRARAVSTVRTETWAGAAWSMFGSTGGALASSPTAAAMATEASATQPPAAPSLSADSLARRRSIHFQSYDGSG